MFQTSRDIININLRYFKTKYLKIDMLVLEIRCYERKHLKNAVYIYMCTKNTKCNTSKNRET